MHQLYDWGGDTGSVKYNCYVQIRIPTADGNQDLEEILVNQGVPYVKKTPTLIQTAGAVHLPCVNKRDRCEALQYFENINVIQHMKGIFKYCSYAMLQRSPVH